MAEVILFRHGAHIFDALQQDVPGAYLFKAAEGCAWTMMFTEAKGQMAASIVAL